MIDGYHRGRSFTGHELEDECPGPQQSCGLVALSEANPDCDQHGRNHMPHSMRQGHAAADCPGGTDTATVLQLAWDALKHVDGHCPAHDTTPPSAEHGARYGPCKDCQQARRVRKAKFAFDVAEIEVRKW